MSDDWDPDCDRVSRWVSICVCRMCLTYILCVLVSGHVCTDSGARTDTNVLGTVGSCVFVRVDRREGLMCPHISFVSPLSLNPSLVLITDVWDHLHGPFPTGHSFTYTVPPSWDPRRIFIRRIVERRKRFAKFYLTYNGYFTLLLIIR